jgi:hypothetical protein
MAVVVLDGKERFRTIHDFRKAVGISYEEFVGTRKKKIADEYHIRTKDIFSNEYGSEISQDKYKGMPIKDHLGNVYKNVSTMCSHYGVNHSTYLRKVDLGVPLEEILTRKSVGREKIVQEVEYNGIIYKSKTEMCRDHGISLATYLNRKSRGFSDEDALRPKIRKSGYKRKSRKQSSKE